MMHTFELTLLILGSLLLHNVESDKLCDAFAGQLTTPYCCDGQMISEVRTRININGTCAYEEKQITSTPNCKKKSVVRGVCEKTRNGKFHCLAEDTIYKTEVDSNCKCVYKEKKKARICCCPDPTTDTTCDDFSGTQETTQTSYNLIESNNIYSCVATVKKHSTKNEFETEYSVTKGKCNSNGLRQDTIRKRYLDNCEIKEIIERKESKICACSDKTRTVTSCLEGTYLVTEVFKRVLSCECGCNCVCKEKVISANRRSIECKQTTIIKAECTGHNSRRSVITTSYELINCDCKEKKEESFEKCLKCYYKQYSRVEGKCCGCGYYDVVTNYRDVDCIDKTETKKLLCRCPNTPPSDKKLCENGKSYTISYRYVMNADKTACCLIKKKIVNPIICSAKTVTIGKCNFERQYYQKVTTMENIVDEKDCVCKPVRKDIFNICDCPQANQTQPTCERNDHLVSSKTTYTINRKTDVCDKKVDIKDVKVSCKKLKDKIETIDECQKVKYIFSVIVKNCRCMKSVKASVNIFSCCKKKPKTNRACENGNLKMTRITTYKVSCDKQKCEPEVSTIRQTIVCPKYFESTRSKCIDGRYTITDTHYRVKNCKCVIVKVDVKPVVVPCNTKEPLIKSVCGGDKWIVTTTSWKIEQCQCVSTSKSVHTPIVCNFPIERKSSCNRKTGKVTVRTTYYVVNQCKCVAKLDIRTIPCPCWKPDRIVRTNCVGITRIVNKLRYKEVNKKCQWTVIVTEYEDCECRKERKVKTCKNNKYIITTTTSYSPMFKQLKLSVEKCVQKICKRSNLLVCNKNYKYKTPCKDFMQSVVSCTFSRRNCLCIKSCKTQCVRACNCKLKNRSAIKCINNVKYRFGYSYKENGEGCGCGCKKSVRNCLVKITQDVISNDCVLTVKRHHCTACIYPKNHGHYKICTKSIMVKRNCHCALKQTRRSRLCHCNEKISCKPFCRANQWVVKTTAFIRKGQICVPKETESLKKIECKRQKLITKVKEHSTEYSLVYYLNVNCKCKVKVKTIIIRKCRTVPVVDKKCFKENWLFTERREEKRYKNYKLFSDFPDSPRASFCEFIVKTWTKPVLCDKDSYVRWCNTKTLQLTKTHYYFVKPACKCIRQSKKSYKPCNKCPPNKETSGECLPRYSKGFRYFDLTITSYKIQENNKCKTFVEHKRKICKCPDPYNARLCKNGKKIFQLATFNIRTVPPCQKQVSEKKQSVYCYNSGKSNPWLLSKTDKCSKPGQFTIGNYVRDEFNPIKCECVKKKRQEKIGICCRPCRSETKCVHNVFVVTTTCEHAKALLCVVTKTFKKNRVYCPRPIKILIGKPVKCFQRYSLTVFNNVNCHCVKKTTIKSKRVCCIPRVTVKRQCEDNKWKFTTTTFHLKKKCTPKCIRKCIASITSYYKPVCTCQLGIETFKDQKIDKCTFWRSYFIRRLINCHYKDIFDRKEILEECCLPLPKTNITCKNNKIEVFTTHSFILCDFHCIPRTSRKEIAIHCRRNVLIERKSTGPCTVDDSYYTYLYKKCKCVKHLIKVEHNEIGCCHKKPYTEKRCDKINGVAITLLYTYHLKHLRCIKCEKRSTVRINCNLTACQTTVGPCIKDNNVVKLFCLRRVGCRCVRELTSQGHQCCKPLSYQWITVGPIINCVRITQYHAFRMDYAMRFCKPVVIKVQRHHCCCPKPHHRSVCINDICTKTITTTYFSKEVCGVCIVRKQERIKCVKKCGKNIKRLGIIRRQCDRKTGWGHITTEYVQARNCRCVKTQRIKRCPCVCAVAFPRQERSYCKNNRQNVKEIKTATCSKCKVKWCLTTQITTDGHCEKIVTEKGNCFDKREGFAVSIRIVSKVQYVLINCKCIRKVIQTTKEHCQCRKPYTTVKCLHSKKQITTHSFGVKNGICRKFTKSNLVSIPCPAKPSVVRSLCHKNKYEIVTKTFYYHNCKCLHHTCRQQCHCKCPQTTVQKRCSGKYWVDVITTMWKIVNCRCWKYKVVKQYRPRCPKFIPTTVGKCIKKGDEGYEKITTRKPDRILGICKCVIRECHQFNLCWCKENSENVNVCINNVLIKQTWKRILCKQKKVCVRVKVSSSVVSIPRPKDLVTDVCNRQTGRDLLTTISYHLNNCVYKSKITRSPGRCICPRLCRLVKKGKCSRPRLCVRTDIYNRKQLRNRRCINVKETKTVRCCCYPKESVRKYCKDNKVHISTIKYILSGYQLHYHGKNRRSHGHPHGRRQGRRKQVYPRVHCNVHPRVCRPIESIAVSLVSCSTKILVRKGDCNINGFRIIRKYKHVNINCTCVLKKIREYSCRCRCCEDSVSYQCNKAKRTKTKTVTIYSILRCKCVERRILTQQLIKCPNMSINISPCQEVKGEDYSIRRTVTITYSVNNQCECVMCKDVQEKICWCKRKEKIVSSCDVKKHVITTRKTYRILQNCVCVKKVEIKKKAVYCGTGQWVLKGDSGCRAVNRYGKRLLTYVRQINVGCGCKEEVKTNQCHCMCNGPRRRITCYNNRIKDTRYEYRMINCRCSVSAFVHWITIRCKQLHPIISKCIPYRNGKYRRYTTHRDVRLEKCKCVIHDKEEWVYCKCKPLPIVKKCIANVFVFTKTWFILQPKKCRKQQQVTTQSIPCDMIPDCIVISKCLGRRKDRQIHRCIFRMLSHCQCKVTTKNVSRPCICKRKQINIGPCNIDTCFRQITVTRYHLVVLRNNQTKCVPRNTYSKEMCRCCKKTKRTIVCHNNKHIETIKTYTFNDKAKKCDRKIRVLDVTPKCSPRKEIHQDKCPGPWPKCDQKTHVTLRALVKCKCNVIKRIFVDKCCCPEDYKTKECIYKNTFKKTFYQYKLTKYTRGKHSYRKCDRKVYVNLKTVCCPSTKERYITKCNYVKRTRVKETVSYIINKCKCVKITKLKDEICRCLDPSTVRECLEKAGVKRRTVTSYFLNTRLYICIRNIAISERKIYCNTKPKTICGRCQVSYNCGTYKICTTFFEVRHCCQCIPRRLSRQRLCRCPRTTSSLICINNVKITKETYYIKVKSGDQSRDLICKKQTRKINPMRIQCPGTIISHGPCINYVRMYTKKYYIKANCACFLRVKTYRIICDCPRPKVISTKCINDNQLEKIIRHSKLVCNTVRSIPRCKCVHIDNRQRVPVLCRKRRHRVRKCVAGRRGIVFIKYVSRQCKCTAVKRVVWINCEECVSEMSHCNKIRTMGLCKKPLFRIYLCQFSCEYCERCPNRCLSKPIGGCVCKKVAGINICSRQTQITKFKIINRKCVKQISIQHSLCGCSHNYSKHKCQELKRQGRCKEREIMRKCEFFCNDNCQRCQGSIRQKRCVQSGKYKAKYRLVTVSFQKLCDACLTQTTVAYVGICKPCSKRQRKVVTACVRGTRYVLTHYVKKEGRRCVNKVIRTAYSCKDCCRSIETKIGNCVDRFRTVLTVFWANINNACKKQNVANRYSCNSRCSAVSQVSSPCVNNKRIIVKVWKSGRNCESHSESEMRSCLPDIS